MKKIYIAFTLLIISMLSISAVDDQGMQVLTKSAEYVSGVSKANYYLKTKLLGFNNSELDLETNSSNQLKVVLDGRVSIENSSSTPLLAGTEFVGASTETLDYAIIFVTVFSNVSSATDGLHIEMSSDGVTWRESSADKFTIPADTEKTFSFQPNKKYFRVHYINGGTNQTTFDLHTVLKKTNSKPSSHRIQDSIIDEDDAELVKAVVTAKSDSGTFVNLAATSSNNLRVANVEDGLSIAKGDVVGTSFIHKFGASPDFDTTDGIVTVWDGADDGDIAQMRYVYSTTADIDTCSSGSTSDTMTIALQGLDASYNLVTQTKTLNGQNKATLDTPLLRLFRVSNEGTADNVGHIYCYVDTAISSGRPTDTTKVRAVIQPTNNQTLMAVYTCPNNKTCYLREWYASTAGASKSSEYVMELRARNLGGVFKLKHVSSISDSGTSYITHQYSEPEIFAAKTDIEMRTSATALGTSSASISAGFDIVTIDN